MKDQITLRFNRELLEILKEKAATENRSLNNYIEHLLYREMENIPNKETKKAIHEARNSINLQPIDELNKFLDDL